MVDFLEKTKFQIIALEGAPREVLADFLKNRPDAAREVLSGRSGPYSVMIKHDKDGKEIVMAHRDTEILTHAECYLADFIGSFDDVAISGAGADNFGNNVQHLIKNLDFYAGAQVYTTEYEKDPDDYRIYLSILVEHYSEVA